MTKLEYARELGSDPARHWNCCQRVLAPFARECGLTEEQAYRLGANFGGGMKIGSTCGAITGGLMVLGMLNAGDEASRAFIQHFRTAHTVLNCPELLKLDRERGNTDRKAHCDGLIYEAIEQVELLTGKQEPADSRG